MGRGGRRGEDQHIEERDEGRRRAWSRRCPGRMTQSSRCREGPEPANVAGGTVFRPGPVPGTADRRGGRRRRGSARAWPVPSRRCRTRPSPAHRMRNTGLELLQKVRSRSASCRVRSLEAYSLPLCGRRWIASSPAPAASAGLGAAGQANRDAISGQPSGASHCPEAQPHQQTGDDQRRGTGRDHRPGAEGQALGCPIAAAGVRQKPDQDPAQDQARTSAVRIRRFLIRITRHTPRGRGRLHT